MRNKYVPRKGAPLGACELEAVRLLAGGLILKGIADARGISRRTVEHQLQNARKKSGSRTLPELTAWAVRQGLV